MQQSLDEASYRKLVKETLDRIENAFDEVDPDIAECHQSLGSMTIQLADGSRCILSGQPSVRQLWLALASKGVAFHFNYDPERKVWMDDKGRNFELISYLESYLKDAAGLDIRF